MSPIYAFLQYLLITVDGLTFGIMAEIILGKGKVCWGVRLRRIAICWLLVILICLPSYLMHEKVLPLINTILYAFGIVLLVSCLFKSSWKVGLLLFMVAYLCQAAGEAAYFLSFPADAIVPCDWTQDPCMHILVKPVCLSGGMKIIFGVLYRSKESGRIRKDPVQVIFSVFLIVFFSMFPSIYYIMSGTGQYAFNNRDTFSLFSTMIAVLVFSAIAFILQNRKAQQKLENLEALKNLQNDYYVSLEKNSASMSKLRHDYLNILQPIGRYIKEDRNAEALALIEDLTGKIKETGQQNRCNIPVVNAILCEKEQLCQAKNIRFTVSLQLIEECLIPDLDLCRVLGNLLDNAIRACERMEIPEARWIELKGKMSQQRLIISCRNACLPNEKKQIFGTGLGQKILKETARQYQGHFKAEELEQGIYVSSIDLLNPQMTAPIEMEVGQA